MSPLTDAERSPSQLPGPERPVLLGTFLGIISSAVGPGCFLAPFIAYGLLAPSGVDWRKPENLLSQLSTAAVFVIVYAVFAFVPATIGGWAIGLILYLVARARRLSVWIAAVIGISVGMIEGGVIAWIVAPMPDTQGWGPNLPRGLLWNGAIGVVQGFFVSILLYAWLNRKMQHQGDEAGSTGLYGRIAIGMIIAAIILGFIVMSLSGSRWLYDSLLNPLGIAALGGLFAVGVLGAWLKWRAM